MSEEQILPPVDSLASKDELPQKSEPQRPRHTFVPMLVAVGVIVGILLGSFFSSHFSRRSLSIINSSSNKINDLFHLIDDQYVDSVDIPTSWRSRCRKF